MRPTPTAQSAARSPLLTVFDARSQRLFTKALFRSQFSSVGTAAQRRAFITQPRNCDWMLARWAAKSQGDFSSVHLLGTAATLGSTKAKEHLVTIARSSTITRLSAQCILNDLRTLQGCCALGYTLTFAEAAYDYSQRLLLRIEKMIKSGTPAEDYAPLSQAYGYGPLHVLVGARDYFDTDKLTPEVERAVDLHIHDALVSNSKVLRDIIPFLMTKAPDHFRESYFFGTINYFWKSFLSTALSYQSIEAQQHGIDLQTGNVPGSLHMPRVFNAKEMRFVIRELVRNAIKYADPAKETRYIKVKMPCDGSALIVEDNGIGIHDTAAIWQYGFRESPQHAAGDGLGLASAQKRLARLGWSIVVESEPGHWTRFTLTPRPGDIQQTRNIGAVTRA